MSLAFGSRNRYSSLISVSFWLLLSSHRIVCHENHNNKLCMWSTVECFRLMVGNNCILIKTKTSRYLSPSLPVFSLAANETNFKLHFRFKSFSTILIAKLLNVAIRLEMMLHVHGFYVHSSYKVAIFRRIAMANMKFYSNGNYISKFFPSFLLFLLLHSKQIVLRCWFFLYDKLSELFY